MKYIDNDDMPNIDFSVSEAKYETRNNVDNTVSTPIVRALLDFLNDKTYTEYRNFSKINISHSTTLNTSAVVPKEDMVR